MPGKMIVMMLLAAVAVVAMGGCQVAMSPATSAMLDAKAASAKADADQAETT